MENRLLRSEPLSISVIIPVAEGETPFQPLVESLQAQVLVEEILVVVNSVAQKTALTELFKPFSHVSVVMGRKGRAQQMNTGARLARGSHLWFLHADSHLCAESFSALSMGLAQKPQALHYFRLKFAEDGPKLTILNEWGALCRSRFLSMPFGDQGLCVERHLFFRAGGYDETVPYGEDNLLVWRLRQHKVDLNYINVPLLTSARKYRKKGWWKVTINHLKVTMEQAIPGYMDLFKSRWDKNRQMVREVVTAPAGKGAICVFVKTPGLSPIKTRLAKEIGTARAEEFYLLSCQTLQQTVLSFADRCTPYWAVAEAQGLNHPLWSQFEQIYQGTGGLGERLDKIYQELISRHPFVIFLGADLPHLRSEDVQRAITTLEARPGFVLGPADDGGYYLFGGNKKLPSTVWRNVTYSAATTLAEFTDLLKPCGVIEFLATNFDIDTAAELQRLRAESACPIIRKGWGMTAGLQDFFGSLPLANPKSSS